MEKMKKSRCQRCLGIFKQHGWLGINDEHWDEYGLVICPSGAGVGTEWWHRNENGRWYLKKGVPDWCWVHGFVRILEEW